MQTARISLAIVSGILLALGCVTSSDLAGINSQRIICGLMFGGATAASMILRRERVSRNVILFLVAPLLLVLVVHEALTSTAVEAIVTAAVSIAFLGVQIAFALPADPAIAPPVAGPDSSVSAPDD